MSNELNALPASFAAATTVEYRKSFCDYPADDGWSLTLYLAGASIAKIAAVADGADFMVTVSAAETGPGFTPGFYKWSERVTKDGDVYEIASGVVDITPDLTQATDGSQQEWLEVAVTTLRAHIEGRLPAGMETYSIGGRAVSKIPVKEAVALLSSFESRLARLKDPTRIGRRVLAAFTGTGFNR